MRWVDLANNPMKKTYAVLIIFFFIFMPQVQGQDALYDRLVTESGLVINSYTENWTGEKLREVYKELLQNKHGDEIKYLKEINLFSYSSSTGGNEEGVYNGTYKTINVLGKKRSILTDNCSISLYNLANKNTVKEFAKTLSHEYGHHFTLYYLMQKENKTFDDWENTTLYKARNLDGYNKVANDYSNDHQWSIIEISAEDYVQLYGSPNAKITVDFKDINERYTENIDQSTRYNYNIYNFNPQENNWIPLVLETDGLKEYWESASGMESEVTNISRPQLALSQIIDLGYDKYQYVFKWTKSIDADGNEADSYTLVASDLEKEIITPVKMVTKNEEKQGIVGSIRINSENKIMYYTDSFLETNMIFKVYAIHNNGGVISSQEQQVDFSHPQETDLNEGAEYVDDFNKVIQYEVKKKSLLDKILDYILDIMINLLYTQ